MAGLIALCIALSVAQSATPPNKIVKDKPYEILK